MGSPVRPAIPGAREDDARSPCARYSRPWPWPWWAFVVIGAPFVAGADASLPPRGGKSERPAVSSSTPRSAFVVGDADGSTFGNASSNADAFIHGNASPALFWNILHARR